MMGSMNLWYPPNDQAHLLEWWRPLILASRAARVEQVPWPINLDEHVLVGRVDRSSRPAVWVYKNTESQGELYLDATGQAYTFTPTPKAKGPGRFKLCDIRIAIYRAGFPQHVDPVWYGDSVVGSRSRDQEWRDDSDAAVDVYAEPEPPSEPDPEPRRRGHLTVHDGGRSMTG
jgi:hypothetical protein